MRKAEFKNRVEKTITLQGTEEQIGNLQLNAYKFKTEDLPALVETRVYVVDMNENDFDGDNTTDEEFITLAENNGRVYTLEGFQQAFNFEEINSSIDVIRFISVESFY